LVRKTTGKPLTASKSAVLLVKLLTSDFYQVQ